MKTMRRALAGTGTVTATVLNVAGQATVAVTATAGATVGVTPGPAAPRTGASLRPAVQARGAQGNFATGVWAADFRRNPAVALVAADGMVTGVRVRVGSVEVSVTVGGATRRVPVQVTL